VHDLLRRLAPGSTVLDLGAGNGSFDYTAYPELRIVAVEPTLDPERDGVSPPERPHATFLRRSSNALIGVDDGSVDAVVANNTFEHFEDLPGTFRELRRVLRDRSGLYAAIPDASRLDDRLFRRLYRGGGHVNRFTPATFAAIVASALDGYRLIDQLDLPTGCVYLSPPASIAPMLTPTMRALALHPRAARVAQNALCSAAEVVDVTFGSTTHLYGHMYYFVRGDGWDDLRFDRTGRTRWTCVGCGANLPRGPLVGRLRCGACGATNVVFRSTRAYEQRRRLAQRVRAAIDERRP
jgi:SAM-dependent methyltransferase